MEGLANTMHLQNQASSKSPKLFFYFFCPRKFKLLAYSYFCKNVWLFTIPSLCFWNYVEFDVSGVVNTLFMTS